MKIAPEVMTGSIIDMTLNTCFSFRLLFFINMKTCQKNTGIKAAPADRVKTAAHVHVLAMKRFRLNRKGSASRDKVRKYIPATVIATQTMSLIMK